MKHLITPAQADRLIDVPVCSPESLALENATGRILAAPVIADRDLPPFSRAMMDGIAFHSTRLDPTSFRIAGLHAAGSPPPPALPPGQAWEIMTGAAVPEDCDTVVRYEDLGPGNTSITGSFKVGQSIHRVASDAEAGNTLLCPGTRLGPTEIATAASVGATKVQIHRLPRVAIITTGDEAVPITADPEPWQIRRSNGIMLAAALEEIGLTPHSIEHVDDKEEPTAEAIDRALRSTDLILLCGGISKGKRDLVRPLVEERLGAPKFHGVLQKPGKPLAFWSGPPPVFALPGNPVSVLATFRRYVLPAIARCQATHFTPALVEVPAAKPLNGLSWLLTVARAEDGTLIPRPPTNSGNFVSVASSVGVIEIPPAEHFSPGQSFHLF